MKKLGPPETAIYNRYQFSRWYQYDNGCRCVRSKITWDRKIWKWRILDKISRTHYTVFILDHLGILIIVERSQLSCRPAIIYRLSWRIPHGETWRSYYFFVDVLHITEFGSRSAPTRLAKPGNHSDPLDQDMKLRTSFRILRDSIHTRFFLFIWMLLFLFYPTHLVLSD